jgi:ferredoxin
MAGLPHFKNSTAGPGKYEPIYLNQFEVIITPPPAVSGKIGFGNNLMLEHVLKVTSLPEYAGSGSAVVIQNYKFSQRTYAPAKPAQTYHQFTIDFGQCMWCGICIDVCPFDALYWADTDMPAGQSRSELIYSIDALAASLPSARRNDGTSAPQINEPPSGRRKK